MKISYSTPNDFNYDLIGRHVICKQKGFVFPPDASVKERTFVVSTDPGYRAERYSRTIKGRWLVDDLPDTISTYGVEAIIVNGKTITRPDESNYTEVDIVAAPVILEGKNKPRGRVAWAETKTETAPAGAIK